MADVAGEAGQIFSDNARTLAPAAVGSQVVLMTVTSVRNFGPPLLANNNHASLPRSSLLLFSMCSVQQTRYVGNIYSLAVPFKSLQGHL